MKTLEQFITEHGLKMNWRTVDTNPNFASDEKWMASAHHFRCVIRKGKRGMTVGYSQGSGVTTDPTLPDVLNCLAMDASALQSSFEEWCGEYGYDVDSRKAEKIFRICRRQGQSLLRILGGQAALDDLMYQTERL